MVVSAVRLTPYGVRRSNSERHSPLKQDGCQQERQHPRGELSLAFHVCSFPERATPAVMLLVYYTMPRAVVNIQFSLSGLTVHFSERPPDAENTAVREKPGRILTTARGHGIMG